MIEFLEGLDYWAWWLLGAALLAFEMVLPGSFMMWLGFAGFAVGLILFAFPDLAWEGQLFAFALLSVASVLIGRAIIRARPIETDQPTLNRRGEQYVGRQFTLSEPIVNGNGKVQVDDSTWKVEGQDLPQGTRVKVVGIDGVVFRVERDEAG